MTCLFVIIPKFGNLTGAGNSFVGTVLIARELRQVSKL